MAEMKKLSDDELGLVVGGAYVNASMTIGEIVGTDHELAGILIDAGIKVTGKQYMDNLSLLDAAKAIGADAYALECRMNDYLSSK